MIWAGPVLRRAAPAGWALALGVLLLGPALGPGYLLSYDMVWVPDLALRSDFLGLGTALPRAVPSDAVIAVLDEVVPGMLLQKLVLLGALVLGGLGAARLAGSSVVARIAAVSVYLWSPYVVERLWIGHWPLLLCWAVLPWLVREGIRMRADPRLGAALPFLLVLGSLSANAGLMSAATLLAVGATRRSTGRLLAVVAAANAPWIVAGLLHLDAATSSTAGAVFGLGDEGPVPAPLAALTLGGIWNAEVVPGSRELLVLPLVLLLAYAALAALGWRPLLDRLGRRTTGALVGLWAAGYLLAVLTWAAPDLVGWLAQNVPAGGLLRDGGRSLALCAPLTAALVAEGVARCARRGPVILVGVGAALLPVAFLPDAAWGISGQLRPADLPAEWADARAGLGRGSGDLLVLPFTSYRAPEWNDHRKVLDPLPRLLEPNYVVNDQLAVDGRVIEGEDPRGPEVLSALALPDAGQRAVALGELGVGAVVLDRAAPSSPTYAADVAGTVVHDGPGLEVTVLDVAVAERAAPRAQWVVIGAGWAAFAAVPLLGFGNLFRAVALRRGMPRRSG